jgi:hypothetical protein
LRRRAFQRIAKGSTVNRPLALDGAVAGGGLGDFQGVNCARQHLFALFGGARQRQLVDVARQAVSRWTKEGCSNAETSKPAEAFPNVSL